MQDLHPDDQPFLPPRSLLGLALAGALVALVAFAMGADAVVAWGALGIALLALAGWALTAPQQARAVLTGRTLRFGGTSVLVTVVVLAALVALYTLIRQANLSVTLGEGSEFALSAEGRAAIEAIGNDPTLPQVQVTTFISASQAGFRDQIELLMAEYEAVSQGKVRNEFVDLDRNPLRAEQLGATNPNQLYVTRLNEAGEPDTEEGELLRFFSQDTLTNAILKKRRRRGLPHLVHRGGGWPGHERLRPGGPLHAQHRPGAAAGLDQPRGAAAGFHRAGQHAAPERPRHRW